MKPKWFHVWKGNHKIDATTQQDRGSKSKNETQIATMGMKGKTHVGNYTDIDSLCDFQKNIDSEDRKRSKLFHIRVISKNTKIDTLIDNICQANLILEEVVKKLGLRRKPHKEPYSLSWLCKKDKLQVTK